MKSNINNNNNNGIPSSEVALATAKATVMIYDDANKKWLPTGSTPGLSKVQLLQNQANGSYRVVGRKIPDHEVVINCLLMKGLKYNQANQTFLQWRDSKQVYGLNFQTKDDAEMFTLTLKSAVDNLNKGAADTISIGKRSLTSETNSIYEDAIENRGVTNSNVPLTSSNINGNTNGLYNNNNNANINGNNGYNNGINNNNSNGNSNNNTMRNVSSATQLSNQQQQQQVMYRQNMDYNNAYQQQQQQQQQQMYQDNSQKIYDIIPDSSYQYHHQTSLNKLNGCNVINGANNMMTNTMNSGAPPPPAPPLPPPAPPLMPNLFDNVHHDNHTSSPVISGGGPPPPPIPQNGFNGANFLDQAKMLRSVPKHDDSNTLSTNGANATANASNNKPAPMDFLTEIKQRLGKFQQDSSGNSQQQVNDTKQDDLDGYKPSNIKKLNTNTAIQKQQQHIDSPKTIKKIPNTNVQTNSNFSTNGAYTSNTNGVSPPPPPPPATTTTSSNGANYNNNSNGIDVNYDRLKQELLVEIRREMQNMKNDIINALINELRKNHL